MSVNVSKLALLAQPAVVSIAASYGVQSNNSDALSAEINKQMTKARETQIEEAAKEVISLAQVKDTFLNGQAAIVVGLEKQILATRGLMASIDRAQKYGDATRNYVPLAAMLGLGLGNADPEMAKIPKNWEAATEVPAAAA